MGGRWEWLNPEPPSCCETRKEIGQGTFRVLSAFSLSWSMDVLIRDFIFVQTVRKIITGLLNAWWRGVCEGVRRLGESMD